MKINKIKFLCTNINITACFEHFFNIGHFQSRDQKQRRKWCRRAVFVKARPTRSLWILSTILVFSVAFLWFGVRYKWFALRNNWRLVFWLHQINQNWEAESKWSQKYCETRPRRHLKETCRSAFFLVRLSDTLVTGYGCTYMPLQSCIPRLIFIPSRPNQHFHPDAAWSPGGYSHIWAI